MADRVAQGALALTALSSTGDSGATASTQGAGVPSSLSSTGVADAAAKADRTVVGAAALSAPSSLQQGTTNNSTSAAGSRLALLRQSSSSTSTLASIAASRNDAPRQTSTLDTGAIKAALAFTAPSSTQEGQAHSVSDASALKETFKSVASSTSPLQAKQASRNEPLRSTAALSALAQAESSALSGALRTRSVAGYGQLDHLDMTIEDALALAVEITDTITLDLNLEG